jgi:hypothetical protein
MKPVVGARSGESSVLHRVALHRRPAPPLTPPLSKISLLLSAAVVATPMQFETLVPLLAIVQAFCVRLTGVVTGPGASLPRLNLSRWM